jgi:release factor glutamine methyltransferase
MSSSPISHLDLCTGTGCIPLLLCHNWPKSSIEALAVDASSHAVALAEENARKAVYSYNALAWDASSALPETRGNTIEILQADIFDPSFPKILSSHRLFPFNLLTCNPPYIPRASWEELPRSVKDHEDPLALIGETPTGTNSLDGLDFYHRIASLLRRPSREPPILAENGVVALEVGVGQAEAVEDILKNTRLFRKAEIWKDQWDVDRVVVGWR